jgi:rhomboid protease GluP
MAFGISPKYVQQLPFGELTHSQILVVMLESVKKIDWNLGNITENGFVAYTKFSMSSYSEEVNVELADGMATLKSECVGNQLVDWGKNKQNIQLLIATFDELTSSINTEDVDLKYSELQQQWVDTDNADHAVPESKGKFSGFISLFIPRAGYFVTPLIININIAIFILMVISGVNFLEPDNQSIITWGANFSPQTLDGQWWRLLSNCFIHIGIFHLLFNMYALAYIGVLLEPYLGKARFATAYILTGITASITSLWWHSFIISAGASGAIFGMYGVFLAMLTTNLIERSARKAFLTSISIFVAYNLMNGMKQGIDNAAHVGGLLGGLLIGYGYIVSLKKPTDTKLAYANIIVLAVFIVLGTAVWYKQIPNIIADYDTKMKTFSDRESLALQIYSLPKTTPKQELLEKINLNGINYWEENIKLLKNVDKLDLPVALHDRNIQLEYYCILRLKSFRLLYKSLDENTDKYQDSIKSYNVSIKTVIDGLKGK